MLEYPKKDKAMRMENTAAGPRHEAVMAAGTWHFARDGFDGTTMRAIALRAGLVAGSIYHYFDSKEALFIAVHGAAVNRMHDCVRDAIHRQASPWEQLGQASRAYLECMLSERDLASLVIMEAPRRRPAPFARRLLAHRRRFEAPFADIVARIDFRPGVDRSSFRLAILGMLAWSHTWYSSGGRDSPGAVADRIIALLRYPNDGGDGEESGEAHRS